MTTITYGTDTYDFSKLPASSLEAMLKRGVNHFFGNEIAAKITGWTKKFMADNDGALPGDDEVAAQRAQFVADFKAKLEAGTVGISTRGPSVDPVEAEMERIAKREINGILKTHNAKWSGKGDERKVTFADGTSSTMDEMVDRRLANAEHGPRIRREAEKAIKDAAKQAAKVNGDKPLDMGAIG